MKKVIICIVAVCMGFVSAVGLCINALLTPKTVFSENGNSLKIVLDAGHGGVDGGVVGRTTKVKESDLNLQIVYRLKDVLTDMGFEVALTRKTEAGLYGVASKGFKRRDMQRRKEIIETENPAYVISVHQNFYPSSATRGAQVFYNAKSEQGKAFAEGVQAELNTLYGKEKVKGRKASKGDFYMLECTESPSLLIECGFLSNAEDERLLSSSAWQTRLAQAIGAGVMGFLSDSAS